MYDISFVVPTYNRAAQTRVAVQSILIQDVAAEVIIVDDASKDHDALRRQFCGDPHIRLVRRNENGGAAAARNTGLDHATAPIISFLDSDDHLLPGTLGIRLEMALSGGIGKGVSPVIFACGWQEVGRSSRQRFPRHSKSGSDFFSACWFGPGSAILVPATLFGGAGGRFDTKLRRLEDFDFFSRQAIKGLSLATQPVLGVAIDTNYSAQSDDIFSSAARIEDKISDMYAAGQITDQELAWAKAYLAYERASAYLRIGKKTSAALSLLKSFVLKPRTQLFPGPGWNDSSPL